MNAALDDVSFLALSENRIALLEVLRDERTHSRDGLREATDVSRPTLARILADLESRAWITQHGQECRITSLGAWVHDEFTDLLEAMETARELREVTRWFPSDDVDFDVVRRLNDAEIVLATESDPTAPIRRASEQVRGGGRLRFLTSQVTLSYVATVRETVTQDGMAVAGILTSDAYDTLVSDTEMADVCRDLFDSGNMAVYVVDDSLPIVQIIDGEVGIGLVDREDAPKGFLVSDDAEVLSWAEELFESRREDASRFAPDGVARSRETTLRYDSGAVDLSEPPR